MLSKLLKILFPYVLLMVMLSTILFDNVETVGVAVLLCHVVDFTFPPILLLMLFFLGGLLYAVIVDAVIFHLASC